MTGKLNGAPLTPTADEAEAKSRAISQQVDIGTATMLMNLIAQQPDEAGAIVSGVVAALVPFVFFHCVRPEMRGSYIAIQNFIAPLVRHYGQREVANLKARDLVERGTEPQ